MHVYVLVGSTICDTSTIYKIQENANFTYRTFVAQIELSQIEGSMFQIERSICGTRSYLRIQVLNWFGLGNVYTIKNQSLLMYTPEINGLMSGSGL